MRHRENVSLNALRALAALLVALGHLRALLFLDYADVPHSLVNKALYAVTGLGHPAVVVFFVLSGYWVGGAVMRSTGRGTFRWRDYLNSRLTRLWLVLLPALALTVLVDAIGRRTAGGSDVYRGTAAYHGVVPAHPEEHRGWDVLLGNIGFLNDIRVPTLGTNSPLWSVGYEWWFYLAFPLAVLAVRTGPVARRIAYAIGLLAVGVLVGRPVIELFPLWLMGVAVAQHAPRLLPGITARVRRLGLLQLVAAAVVFATMLVGSQRAGLAGDVVIGVATAALVLLLVPDLDRDAAAGLRAVGWYAHSSYSLYAIHLPLVALLAAVVIPQAADRWAPSPVHLTALLGALALVAAVAWVFARLTEHWTDDARAWTAARIASRS